MIKFMGIERYIFSEFYSLFEKNVRINDTYEEWERVIKEFKGLREKYENHPLAEALAIALISDLEGRIHNKEIKGHSIEYWEEVKEQAIEKQMR